MEPDAKPRRGDASFVRGADPGIGVPASTLRRTSTRFVGRAELELNRTYGLRRLTNFFRSSSCFDGDHETNPEVGGPHRLDGTVDGRRSRCQLQSRCRPLRARGCHGDDRPPGGRIGPSRRSHRPIRAGQVGFGGERWSPRAGPLHDPSALGGHRGGGVRGDRRGPVSAAYEQLRQMLSWLRLPLADPDAAGY